MTMTGLQAAEQSPTAILTVHVAGQALGLPVMSVRDVLAEPQPTPVPLAPRAVAGNLNLRGRVAIAICLRRRLGLPDAPHGQSRMAVLAEQGSELCALLVDQVGEVATLSAAQLEPPPATLPPGIAAFAESVARLPDALLLMLSVPRLLDVRPQD